MHQFSVSDMEIKTEIILQSLRFFYIIEDIDGCQYIIEDTGKELLKDLGIKQLDCNITPF